MLQSFRPSEEPFKKFHYPVEIACGTPVGLYETIFNTESAYLYKVCSL